MHTDDNDFNDIYSDVNLDDDSIYNDSHIDDMKKNSRVDDNLEANEDDVAQNFYGYEEFNNDDNNDVKDKKTNKAKKIIIIVIVILILLLCIGGLIFFLVRNNESGNNGNEQPVLTPSIVLSQTDFELTVGSSKKLTYTVENYTEELSVTWSSSDKSIATVSENGTVKGVKAGNAIITAVYIVDEKEYKETCSVTVKKKTSTGTTTPTVTLSKTKLELKVGSSEKITYTVKNNTGSISVTWSSSDKSVATVSENGTVKGIKEGNATITATYTVNGTKYKKTCSVTIRKNDSGTSTPPVDKTVPSLSYTIISGKENTWVNTDVTIKLFASDSNGNVSIKYATDCSSNCSYSILSGDRITISSAGTTSVVIVVTNTLNKQTSKKVTVMIDKSSPSCSLEVKEDGNVLASYWDSGGSGVASYGFSSGSTSLKVSSAGTYSYSVKDKAGNVGSCSISVKAKTQYRYKTCVVLNNSGGCATWSSEYSSWSDIKVTSSSTKKVETRTVYYS